MSKNFDWLLFLSTIFLCVMGLSLIYSVFYPHGDGYPDQMTYFYFNRQMIWVCLGMAAMFFGFVIPFRYYEALAYAIYGACVMLLIVVMFIKQGGPNRWVPLGPLKLQPSEFMKIALLFAWARILSGHRSTGDRLRPVMVVSAITMLPFLLVLKQPDLGTAIVFLGMMIPVLYWRGLKAHHVLLLTSPILAGLLVLYGEQVDNNPWPYGIYIVIIFIIAYFRRSNLIESVTLVGANVGVGIILPMFWMRLHEYQQRRILNFLDPGEDKLGAGWQVFQSKIAIGSGGILGKGYLKGTQKALEFVPAKHTDFIFSVLGEELGFVSGLMVLVLFFVIIFRALSIAGKVKSQFAATACIGVAAYFFFQVFVNVAMTTGMAPVTGIPLPFLSYGGSSLMVSCFFVGFLLNCVGRWNEY